MIRSIWLLCGICRDSAFCEYWRNNCRVDETLGSVVGRADRFMYQAKTRKNLVVTESNEIKDGNADGAEVNRDELKQQILIVDDAELNRDILAEILHHDFKTMEVSNGRNVSPCFGSMVQESHWCCLIL